MRPCSEYPRTFQKDHGQEVASAVHYKFTPNLSYLLTLSHRRNQVLPPPQSTKATSPKLLSSFHLHQALPHLRSPISTPTPGCSRPHAAPRPTSLRGHRSAGRRRGAWCTGPSGPRRLKDGPRGRSSGRRCAVEKRVGGRRF